MELKLLGTTLARPLSSVPDLPVFKTPHAGKYRLKLESIEEKEVAKAPAIIFNWVVIGVHKLADPNVDKEELVVAGDKFGEMFRFDDKGDSEKTLGDMKAHVLPLAAHYGTDQLDQLLGKIEGVVVDVTIENRVQKDTMPPKRFAKTLNWVLATS